MREYYKKIETGNAKNLDEIGKAIAGYYDEIHSDNYYIENGELYVEFPKDWEEMTFKDQKELLDFIKETTTPEKWVEFKLINSEDDRIYLKGNVDINTINDDEVEFEFEQNDGTYDTRIPHYWKTRGEDLTESFEIFIHSIDWDMLKQYLWDFQDENDTVNFYGDILIINEGNDKSTTIRIKQSTKIKLSKLGNKNDSFDDIINKLLTQ